MPIMYDFYPQTETEQKNKIYVHALPLETLIFIRDHIHQPFVLEYMKYINTSIKEKIKRRQGALQKNIEYYLNFTNLTPVFDTIYSFIYGLDSENNNGIEIIKKKVQLNPILS